MKKLSTFGASITIFVAILGALGYLPGFEVLGSVSENFIPMAPSTAISFLFLGLILLVLNSSKPKSKKSIILLIVSALVSLFGILEVVGHFSGTDLNFENTLVPDLGDLGGAPIARMSPVTGALFFFSGTALVLALHSTPIIKRISIGIYFVNGLGVLVLLSSFIFCLAYLYGSPFLYGSGATVPMALTTAVGFLFLSFSVLSLAKTTFFQLLHNQRSTQGILFRFILPFSILSVVVGGIATLPLQKISGTNPAFLSATLTVLIAVIAAFLSSFIARHLGTTIDDLEAKYREIVEGTNDLITIVDNDGKFIFVNSMSNSIFGLSPEDCIGRLASDFIHPDDKEPAIEAFQGWLADKKSTVTYENRQISVTHDVHSMLWTINIHYDEAGNFETLNSIARDITERMNIEEELRNALVDAERANQAKSEFLASMSHELRTPLNAVLGFAQLMQFDPKNPLSPDQKSHTDDILEGGNHLLGLVNEILDLARVEADQIDLSLSDVEAKTVVADCVGLITSLGELREIRTIDQFSNGPSILLLTDQARLKQVLINLLSNAVKFNKNGGTVVIEGNEVISGFLRISVTDTGKGIHEDDRSSVFHLFHRLDVDPMVATEGTGIGLTVSKLLVEQMAGRIGFESEVGIGSTFWIDLPLASNEDVLIWSDAMRVGVDAIDKDHQVLISLLNRIMRRIASDSDVDDIIGKLVDYIHYHFKREETLMEVCDYPDIEKHRVLHRKLVDEVNDHNEVWGKEPSQENFIKFRRFIKNWLFDHILEQDTKILPYTKGKGRDIIKALKELG